MGIPLRQGRVFDRARTARFDAGRDRERAVRGEVFPGPERHRQAHHAGLLGRRHGEKMREIVGVVGNVKHLSLKLTRTRRRCMCRMTQIPFSIMSLVVRTSVADPAALTSAIRKEAGCHRQRAATPGGPSLRRIRFALARTDALQRAAALDFCGNCAAPDRDRHLRRDGLLGRATHKRDRHPHGARRGAVVDLPARGRAGDAAGGDQSCDRPGRRFRGHTIAQQPRLRRRRLGSR